VDGSGTVFGRDRLLAVPNDSGLDPWLKTVVNHLLSDFTRLNPTVSRLYDCTTVYSSHSRCLSAQDRFPPATRALARANRRSRFTIVLIEKGMCSDQWVRFDNLVLAK
jgi:hypothetical protein